MMCLAKGRQRAKKLAQLIGASVHVAPEAILGRRRRAEIVAARHQLFVDLWREGYSIKAIGEVLERDHATVIHGLRKALGDADYDRELAARYPTSPNLRACRAPTPVAALASVRRRS